MQQGRSQEMAQAAWRLLWKIVLVLLIMYWFVHLRAVVITLLIGGILAYMFEPCISWIMRRHRFNQFHIALWKTMGNLVRRPTHLSRHTLHLFATLYTLVIGVIICGYGVKLVFAPFKEQVLQIYEKRSEYQKTYETKVPLETRQWVEKQVGNEELHKRVMDAVVPWALQGLNSLKYVVEIVLLPVLAFYFILDGAKLKREFVALAPKRYFREVVRMLYEFDLIMRSYVLGQFILCALAGIIVGIGLALIGVKYAFVLAVLAAVTRAIPIVGPIIGGIPIIALTYLDDPVNGLSEAIFVLIFFTILHFAESKFIMPMLIGERMELHPVIIIVVLLIGGEVGNVVLGGTLGVLLGMFFAPPVSALLRVMICRYILKIPRRKAHIPHKIA